MVYRLASPAFNAFISNDPGRTGFDSRYRNYDYSKFLFRLSCDVFSLFCKGNSSHVILAAAAVLEGFYDLPYYRYLVLVLGTTYYIKSDKVDEEHGYIGGTSSFRPPGHRYLPLTVGMTEPTLPGRYTCMSSSRSAVQADRQADFTQ